MIADVSSIFWGLSVALNIILALIGLPILLLICCCCAKSGTFQKDWNSIAKNHNLIKDKERRKKRKRIEDKKPKITELEGDEGVKDLVE